MVAIVSIVTVVMSVLVEVETPLVDISKERVLLRLKQPSRVNMAMTGTSIAINVMLYGGFILHTVYN